MFASIYRLNDGVRLIEAKMNENESACLHYLINI